MSSSDEEDSTSGSDCGSAFSSSLLVCSAFSVFFSFLTVSYVNNLFKFNLKPGLIADYLLDLLSFSLIRTE